uniref:Uncharacterized protein n=1 Tax=Erythrolobus australicus TaxID=1077150 RepID=A0A7S1TL91_9RHOD
MAGSCGATRTGCRDERTAARRCARPAPQLGVRCRAKKGDGSGPGENSGAQTEAGNASEQQMQAFELSRRVFIVVLGSWSVWISAKLFYQRQLDLIVDRVSAWFNPQRKAASLSVESTFAKILLEAPLTVIEEQQGRESAEEILSEEAVLRKRSGNFFGASAKERANSSDELFYEAEWMTHARLDSSSLNWLLYCRMHSICAALPAPASRRRFMSALGARLLQDAVDPTGSLTRDATSEAIISGVTQILKRLKNVGYISSFSVDMSALSQELYADGERTQLAVFVDDVVTMPAAQTLAGESYNDLAPVFIGNLLAAFIETCNSSCDFEEFYIDNSFQRNPYAYDPTGCVVALNLQRQL